MGTEGVLDSVRRLTASWRTSREFRRAAAIVGLMSFIPGAALLPVASAISAEIRSASPAPMVSRLVAPSPIAPDSLVILTATEESVTGLYAGQVTASSLATTGSEPITLTVAPSGTFTVTVVSSPIALTVAGSTATGTLQGVTVTDSRNYYPGWSVTGQAADLTASGAPAIAGNQLGWTPDADGSLQGGAMLGGSVAPAAPGLGTTPATLASAAAGCGFGTNKLSARLTLDIPAPATVRRRYAGLLTITYVESWLGRATGCGRTTT